MNKNKATKETIDDLISEWHDSETTLSLHEYLGLSVEEYATWVNTSELPKNENKTVDK